MKYTFLPKMMWVAFRGTFTEALSDVLNVKKPKTVMKRAHKKYKEILGDVDQFEKNDRFLFNILSASMLAAVLLSVDEKPTVEQARQFYSTAMKNNFFMNRAVAKSDSYTAKGREKLKVDAVRSQGNTNPYSWKFEVEDGQTINQYTATFYTCGICYLMKSLGLEEYVPAMCAFDYDMAEMSGTTFTREYTLASGGPYCDCHYDHKG